MKKYDPQTIEPKWQKIWADTSLYAAKTGDKTRPKYYMLTEFPYPSGAGVHAGHTREYTLGDVISRHKRMLGYNVLYPMGYDAFGLPTENYAIKNKIPPQVATAQNIAIFRQQFDSLGLSFDWDREINTTDPSYYKWTQWLFLRFIKSGLAYQAEMAINWCPKERTGLANEEVVNGVHERCGTPVEKKLIKQWMLKITAYADRLIEGLKTVDFPPRIADQQINWIGRSQGAEISWEICDQDGHAPKRTYVLIHGFQGNLTQDFAWVKSELEHQGHTVITPTMPDTMAPTEKGWVEAVLNAHDYDENTILVGYSLGAVAALKALEKMRPGVRIGGLVLAAGFIDPNFTDHPRAFESTFTWDFDALKIKQHVSTVKILHDTTDTAVSDDQAQRLSSLLNVPLTRVKAEKPHFGGDQEPVFLMALAPSIVTFTTRKDTLPGVTFIAVAPESPLLDSLTTNAQRSQVDAYRKKVQGVSELDRQEAKLKTGVPTGMYAKNPFNSDVIPIYVADYILAGYGTGVVMGMGGHDERDREFALGYNLPNILTTAVPEEFADLKSRKVYSGPGLQINSGVGYDGLPNREAGAKIFAELVAAGKATSRTQYKLRDWIFSRQHYWGEPIPVIHCPKCGVVPVPESQLPVILPEVEHYEPTSTGQSPLAAISDWVNVPCPKCEEPAKRETDTMPNWAGSSWYYLRYMDPRNDSEFASPEALKYWGMADLYLGGMEHTTLHLLYSRFWHQFLYDEGLVPTPEPYAARRGQGIVLASDGRKMSKSIGNVINPTDIIASHGADILRLYVLFMAPYDETTPWSEERLNGSSRFIYKVWHWAGEMLDDSYILPDSVGYENDLGAFTVEVDRASHKTIKKIHDDMNDMHFNTAVSSLMEYVNFLNDPKTKRCLLQANALDLRERTLRTLILLLAPITPHLSEELWHDLGEEGSVHVAAWPKYDPELIKDDFVTIVVQVAGKVRSNLFMAANSTDEEIKETSMADPKISKLLAGQTITRTIVVPRKLINFVLK